MCKRQLTKKRPLKIKLI